MQEEITGVDGDNGALSEGGEPMLVVRISGTMAQVLETIRSLAEHAGDKTVEYFARRPVVRLKRR